MLPVESHYRFNIGFFTRNYLTRAQKAAECAASALSASSSVYLFKSFRNCFFKIYSSLPTFLFNLKQFSHQTRNRSIKQSLDC